MPELTFAVRWPDGTVDDCYSPSLVVHDHLAAGTTYTVAEFVRRSGTALAIASDRVREKFGFACSSAEDTRGQIARRASEFGADDLVEVLSLHPPLPTQECAP